MNHSVYLLSRCCSGTGIGKSWKNNNAESYNHVLKSKTQWRQLKHMTDVIESIRGLVDIQLKDLNRKICCCLNCRCIDNCGVPFRRKLQSAP